MCFLANDALNKYWKSSKCHEEGVNGENSVERKSSRCCYSPSLRRPRGSFTLFALEFISGVSDNFWQSSAGHDHPEEFLFGEGAACVDGLASPSTSTFYFWNCNKFWSYESGVLNDNLKHQLLNNKEVESKLNFRLKYWLPTVLVLLRLQQILQRMEAAQQTRKKTITDGQVIFKPLFATTMIWFQF